MSYYKKAAEFRVLIKDLAFTSDISIIITTNISAVSTSWSTELFVLLQYKGLIHHGVLTALAYVDMMIMSLVTLVSENQA